MSVSRIQTAVPVILCSFLSGIWGAWIGFGGYLRLPPNHDSFAMFFVLGYFIFFSLVGLVLGFGFCFVLWKSVETLLLRLGLNSAIAKAAASLVALLGVWMLTSFVQAKYPGLRATGAKKVTLSNIGVVNPRFAAVRRPSTWYRDGLWNLPIQNTLPS